MSRSRTIELPSDWEKQLAVGWEATREFAEGVPARVEAAWAEVAPHVDKGVRAVSPYVDKGRRAVSPYVDKGVEAVSPYVDQARTQISPAVKRVAPLAEEARDRIAPSVDYARHHLLTTVGPAITSAVDQAMEASAPVRAEIARRGDAAFAALRGEVSQQRAGRRWPFALGFLAAGAAAGAAASAALRRSQQQPGQVHHLGAVGGVNQPPSDTPARPGSAPSETGSPKDPGAPRA